jgi:hypothetical protein
MKKIFFTIINEDFRRLNADKTIPYVRRKNMLSNM